jgi:ribonuclease G
VFPWHCELTARAPSRAAGHVTHHVRSNEHMHVERYEIVPGDVQEMERQMMPWKRGEMIDCQVIRNPFSVLPRASAWLDGYLVELENGGKYVGRRVKAKLTEIHRSYAFGEVAASGKAEKAGR